MRAGLSDAASSAWEEIRASRFRSLLTMAGVVLGVASVILLVSLGDGAKRFVEMKFAELGTNVLIVVPGHSETTGGSLPIVAGSEHLLTLDDALELSRRCPAVKAVSPVVVGNGTVRARGRSRDVTVLGVTWEFQEVRNVRAQTGVFLPRRREEWGRRVAVIGRKVQRELFAGQNPLGQRLEVAGVVHRVVGVMEAKGYSLGFDFDDLVLIPVRSAQSVFNQEGLFEVVASAATPERIEEATAQIRACLKRRHNGAEDFTLLNQDDMLSTFGAILDSLTWALGAIAAISLLVAGFGVMNIMLASVGERTREIGIRMALGARRSQVLLQFLLESAALGSLGGAAGVLLGVGGAVGLHLIFPGMPLSVAPWAVVSAFSFSVGVGLVFGVIPARRASRLDPIAALRHE